MDLSVIIVNYNTEEFLQRCLASVYEFTDGIDYELIVVDNNSNDGSVRMVEQSFPSVKLIRNVKNAGFAAANNIGVENSVGTYILFLNSDTRVMEGVLKNAAVYMDEHSDVGILGCKILNYDGTIQPSARDFPTIWTLLLEAFAVTKLLPHNGLIRNPWITDYNLEQDVDMVKGAFLLTRKAVIDQHGKMDERFFLYSEEQDFCYRVKKKWRIVYWPHGSIYHAEGGSSSIGEGSARLNLFDSEIKYFKKHFGRAYAFFALLAMLLAVWLRVLAWSTLVLIGTAVGRKKAEHVEKMKYFLYSLKRIREIKI